MGRGGVAADLLSVLCQSRQERWRPDLLSPALDAPSRPRHSRACGTGVMNGGERTRSDGSAKPLAVNLPGPLAHLNSAGSAARRGTVKIMGCCDKASGPADTKGSPRPLPLLVRDE